MDDLESVLAIPREEVLLASAKDGTGVPEILEAIVARIPAPKGDPTKPLKGLIFDSHYDAYKGVVVYVRLAQGTLRHGEPIRLMASGAEADPLELGVFRPQLVPVRQLVAGEVGYVATGLKSVRDAQVGDTVTTVAHPATEPLPGYQAAKSLVFAGHLPGQRRGLPAPARRAREAPPQRRVVHLRARVVGRPRASGSAAASSACSTWRSSRSGSSASSAST